MKCAPDDLIKAVGMRVAGLGFELVDLKSRVSRGRTVLQVRVDREDSAPGNGITADDCATVSRALEEWFDDSGILGERYVLEVSSPGIERPIRFPKHWERFVGSDVRVRISGRRQARATIVKVPDEATVVLRFAEDGVERAVPLKEVRDATLVVDWSNLDRSLTRTVSKESQ